MKLINSLTDAADQLVSVVLDDGSVVRIEFFYRSAAQQWYIDVTHTDLTLRGLRLTQGANILRPWRNTAPFGLLVRAVDFVDPILSTDFQTGRVLVYVLSTAEVLQVEETVYANPGLAS